MYLLCKYLVFVDNYILLLLLLIMAATDADVSDRDGEDFANNCEYTGSKMFKCCSKATKTCICKNCLSIFHDSCVKRNKNVKIVSEMIVECCTTAKNDEIKPNPEDQNEEVNQLRLEVKYLKILVEEMKDKNNVLSINNSLLLDRLKDLTKNDVNMPEKNRYPRSVINNDSSSKQELQIPTNPVIARNYANVTKGISTQTTEPDVSNVKVRNDSQHRNYQHKQKQTSKTQYETTEPKNETKKISQETSDEFKVVMNRRNNRRIISAKNLGTAKLEDKEKTTGFSAIERKVWIYIYRINKHVSEQIIRDYIKKQQDFSTCNIEVKQLDGDPSFSKRFLVTAPINKKEVLYDPSFWPEGVGIKRFDFSKHKEFLSKNTSFPGQ